MARTNIQFENIDKDDIDEIIRRLEQQEALMAFDDEETPMDVDDFDSSLSSIEYYLSSDEDEDFDEESSEEVVALAPMNHTPTDVAPQVNPAAIPEDENNNSSARDNMLAENQVDKEAD